VPRWRPSWRPPKSIRRRASAFGFSHPPDSGPHRSDGRSAAGLLKAGAAAIRDLAPRDPRLEISNGDVCELFRHRLRPVGNVGVTTTPCLAVLPGVMHDDARRPAKSSIIATSQRYGVGNCYLVSTGLR
jgi:hypothetical protein